MYLSDVDALLSNPVWKEIIETIKETKQGLIDDLKDLDPVKEPTLLARQQGRMMAFDFIMSLPEDFRQEIESENKRKEKED
jgi:hypothetical protein